MKKKRETFIDFDPVEYLETDEDIALYLASAMETGDPAYIAGSLGDVLRAKGMTQMAKKTGIARELLYRSFCAGGNPTLKTMLAVMKALGVKLTTQTKQHHAA